MKKKKLSKQIKALRKQVQELQKLQNNKPIIKPIINPIGFQQVLRNDECDNDYDNCGEISWVEAKK